MFLLLFHSYYNDFVRFLCIERTHHRPQSTGLTSNTILAVSRFGSSFELDCGVVSGSSRSLGHVTTVGEFRHVGGALADIAAALPYLPSSSSASSSSLSNDIICVGTFFFLFSRFMLEVPTKAKKRLHYARFSQ